MALGDATSVQAKTGQSFEFYYDAAGSATVEGVATWTKIEGMKSGALPSPDKPEIDVSTTDDTVKAYIPGLGSIADLSIEFNFYPDNAVHQNLVRTVLYNDTPRPWKLVGQGMVVTFLGYMKSANVSFGVDAAMTMPLVLKVTTKPTVVFDSTPAIVRVTPPLNNTYVLNDTVDLVLNFSENVTVTGTPKVLLLVGATTKDASYTSGSGTAALTFRYTVGAGDSAPNGIVAFSPVVLGAGTIKDADNNVPDLSFVAPTMTGVIVSTS